MVVALLTILFRAFVCSVQRLFHQTSCQVSFTEYRSSWDLECSGQGWSSPQNLGISCDAGRVLVAWENAAIAHTNDFVEFVLDYDGKQYESSKMTMVMVMSWHC